MQILSLSLAGRSYVYHILKQNHWGIYYLTLVVLFLKAYIVYLTIQDAQQIETEKTKHQGTLIESWEKKYA